MTKTICEWRNVDDIWDYCVRHPFMKGFAVPVLSLPSGVAEYGPPVTTMGYHLKGRDGYALSAKVCGNATMHYRVRVWPK